MKLRNQKILLMLLISAVSLSGFSMGVEAKSTNRFNKTVSVVEGTLLDESKGLFFNMNFAEGELSSGATFFIDAEDFAFKERAYRGWEENGVKVTCLDDSRLKVEIARVYREKSISIPVYGEVLQGTPALVVKSAGSKATSGTYPITTTEVTTGYALEAGVESVPNLAIDGKGEVGVIQITERVAGTLQSGNRMRLTLPFYSNVKFRMPNTVEIEGIRGTDATHATLRVDKKYSSDKELVLVVEGLTPSTARGGIKLSGIEVIPEDKGEELELGEVTLTIKMDELPRTQLLVARVAEEGLNLEVQEEVLLVAGKESKRVTVTVSENTAGSLNRRHDVYFEVKGANIVPGTLKVVGDQPITLKEERDAKNKEVLGFTLDTRRIDPFAITKATFSFEVEGMAQELGDITLVADAFKFEEEVKLGQVTSGLAVKMNPIKLKTALKDQVGGEIIIKETSSGLFESGNEVVIEVEKAGEGITFTDAHVEGEDVRLKETRFEEGKIIITIERGSDEGAIISISDIEMCVEGLVDEGSYDVLMSGSGISDQKEDYIVLPNSLQVGEKVQKDEGVTAGFTIGQAFYLLEGKEKEMDAAPYLAESGRVMVPVKYVADAFGLGERMQFSNANGGMITIDTGTRILQLANESDIAIVNGVETPMDEKVSIVGGRTYVPVGPVARLLDIEVNWSAVNQTATFTN